MVAGRQAEAEEAIGDFIVAGEHNSLKVEEEKEVIDRWELGSE